MRSEFHGMMVSLYADYEPPYLIRFLKSSDNYPMQEALETCKQRKMHPEMIFLLGNFLRINLLNQTDFQQVIFTACFKLYIVYSL